MADYFSGIGGAKISGGGAYYQAGKFVCKVGLVKMVENRNREDLFTVETEVKESSNPEIQVGEKRTYQCKVKTDTFLGNVKAFLAACMGANPGNDAAVAEVLPNGEESADAARYAIGPDNPLAGTWLNLTCSNKKTKKSGYKDDFTVHAWQPYPLSGQALHPEYVAEQAAAAAQPK